MNINDSLQDLLFSYSAIIRKIARNNSISFSNALILLSIPSNGIIISDLANKLGIEKTTMTRNLTRLKLEKLVIIKKNDYDIRSKLIFISNQGDHLINTLNNSINQHIVSIIKKLSYDDEENILNSLNILAWNFINEK